MNTIQNKWYIQIYFKEDLTDIMINNIFEKQSIGIGFNIDIDMKNSTKNGIDLYINNYKKFTQKQKKYVLDTFDIFINQMKIGDIVYLCKGHSDILYKAIISSDYYFDSTGGSNGTEIYKFWHHRRNIVNIEPCNFKKKFPNNSILHTT
tara:strand:+ start:266 stop:712 length:447 start_codon:yes stop_codon:yes gene_type:complete